MPAASLHTASPEIGPGPGLPDSEVFFADGGYPGAAFGVVAQQLRECVILRDIRRAGHGFGLPDKCERFDRGFDDRY